MPPSGLTAECPRLAGTPTPDRQKPPSGSFLREADTISRRARALPLGRLVCGAIVTLAIITPVAAQEATTGEIAGLVVDAQGLALPGATITVTGAQGTKSAVTDGEGRFLIRFLIPGPHSVRVELQGFRPAEVQSVEGQLGQRTILPTSHCVSAVNEQVEVVATPASVDSRSTGIGATLDSEFLERLNAPSHPTPGRDLVRGRAPVWFGPRYPLSRV